MTMAIFILLLPIVMPFVLIYIVFSILFLFHCRTCHKTKFKKYQVQRTDGGNKIDRCMKCHDEIISRAV